jgi:dynein light intermediate chain 1
MNKNCDLLYKYLVNRVYGLPFKTPALVVEKDAVFIPGGWDNEKKIEILYENIQSFRPDDLYEEVIRRPPSRQPLQKDAEISCEEDQMFLLKMQSMLTQNSPAPQTNMLYKAFDKRPTPSASPSVDSASKAGEGVLQNFFNNLLNRKSSLAGSPHSPSASTRLSTSTAQVTPVKSSLSPSVSLNSSSSASASSDSPNASK